MWEDVLPHVRMAPFVINRLKAVPNVVLQDSWFFANNFEGKKGNRLFLPFVRTGQLHFYIK